MCTGKVVKQYPGGGGGEQSWGKKQRNGQKEGGQVCFDSPPTEEIKKESNSKGAGVWQRKEREEGSRNKKVIGSW